MAAFVQKDKRSLFVELTVRRWIRSMVSIDRLNRMVSWGQYMHWADLQYSHFKTLNENDHESVYIGARSHWIASQYIVIEGWNELELHDKVIEQLLDKYSDYVDTFRRCRNAVYHYQKTILDQRILEAMRDEELYIWLVAIKFEFERYLYFYPFVNYGINLDSIELSKYYFGIIGWTPKDNLHVKKFEVYSLCRNYIDGNENNKLKKTRENDSIIAEQLESLSKLNAAFLIPKLSRLD